MALKELFWYDKEGMWAVVRWDSEKGQVGREENIPFERLAPIGNACLFDDAAGRSINEIVEDLHKIFVDGHPGIEIYRKINAFCVGGALPGPRDIPFIGAVAINFYCIKD